MSTPAEGKNTMCGAVRSGEGSAVSRRRSLWDSFRPKLSQILFCGISCFIVFVFIIPMSGREVDTLIT